MAISLGYKGCWWRNPWSSCPSSLNYLSAILGSLTSLQTSHVFFPVLTFLIPPFHCPKNSVFSALSLSPVFLPAAATGWRNWEFVSLLGFFLLGAKKSLVSRIVPERRKAFPQAWLHGGKWLSSSLRRLWKEGKLQTARMFPERSQGFLCSCRCNSATQNQGKELRLLLSLTDRLNQLDLEQDKGTR